MLVAEAVGVFAIALGNDGITATRDALLVDFTSVGRSTDLEKEGLYE